MNVKFFKPSKTGYFSHEITPMPAIIFIYACRNRKFHLIWECRGFDGTGVWHFSSSEDVPSLIFPGFMMPRRTWCETRVNKEEPTFCPQFTFYPAFHIPLGWDKIGCTAIMFLRMGINKFNTEYIFDVHFRINSNRFWGTFILNDHLAKLN